MNRMTSMSNMTCYNVFNIKINNNNNNNNNNKCQIRHVINKKIVNFNSKIAE